MPFQEGDSFDRYVIEASLGKGGMGEVYRAHDTRLRRRIALKVLKLDKEAGATGSRGASERLLREARAAAALDHPNAVSVFDVGEVNGTPYIAMELVQGTCLRDCIGEPSVPYERRVRWLIDVARALAAAHERGLVHRDVKPENVMVREDGVVKVLDFGIAKRMTLEVDGLADGGSAVDIASAATETLKGTIVGTPRYLAPEQVAGEEVDGRTDQFAWGVLAYELLNGAPPWSEDRGVMQMLIAILSQDPRPIGELLPELPPAVATTVTRALAKKPGDRFASMGDLVAALEPFDSPSRRSMKEFSINLASGRLGVRTPVQTTLRAPPPAARPQSWRIAAGSGLAAVVIAATLAVRANVRREDNASAVPAVSSTARPRIAVTDLPPPSSGNAEAVAAYRAAMQAFRDGTFATTREQLARAVQLDPALGSGHLRLAIFDSLVEADEAEARRSFKRAAQFRGGLSAHDTALLDAVEPYFQRDPSDPAECERRMRAASDRFPDDAEFAFFLGWIRYDLGRLRAALEAFDRAIDIDPKFALAWSNKAGCQAYLGNLDGALASLDTCLSMSSQATESLWYRVLIFEEQGECARAEQEARRWISKDSEDHFAYAALARALLAQNRPLETVRAALEQKWAHVEPEQRARTEALDRALLAEMSGDFDAAEKEALALERLVAGEPNAIAHAHPARVLVELYRETGRDALARQVADRYVKRKDAWQPAQRVDDGAIAADPIPEMLGALAHDGPLDPSAFDAARREWLGGWEAKTSESFFHYLWVYAYAAPAETPDEARTALAALPKYAPLPAFVPQSASLGPVGEVYRLAGRIEDAVPLLTRATRACTVLYRPTLHTRAHLWLGEALAAQGESAKACAAYRVVLDRWGSDKRSVSARKAREWRAALGCK